MKLSYWLYIMEKLDEQSLILLEILQKQEAAIERLAN